MNDQSEQDHESDVVRPVHEIRLGRIKAAVWANPSDNGVWHTVTIMKLYRAESTSEWRTSHSFGRDELLIVAEAARQAAVWIFNKG